jgi:hypothetical protein
VRAPPPGRNVFVMIEEEPKTGPLDVSRTLTDAMEQAGVHPAYIHAVKRCGFVLTEGNEASLTADQVTRWHAAVEEWFDANPDPGLGNGRSPY